MNSEGRAKIAVLFHRLGPYHFARLRAAGRLLPIVAIESSGVDETYAWDVVAGADHFERVTLFDRADAQKLPAAEVASRVGLALGKVRPAVVVVPGWADFAALGALRWCLQNHVPAIVMSESTAWDETRVAWKEWFKRRIVGLCSAALVGGTPHKDYMVQLGMPAERVFLGYDAVDDSYFADKVAEVRSRESEIRARHGLPEKYFLASARFVEKKNLPRLLQAFARYRELAAKVENRKQPGEVASQRLHGPGKAEIWDLVLLGDGPLKSDLCHLISDLRLDACVHLPGFKQYDELPVYYSLASAFVHASATEQWGLVVNEAMASGLPVLVSNRCGCAQDLVQEGKNGFTFDPYNVEQLAQLMLKLSPLNPEKGRGPHGALRPQLSAFGSESHRIISQWGPERFAKGLHDAVQTVLKNPASNASLMDRLILRLLMAK
jgi:1,2-diacylglycerol 3-alpha-glucosyltransferase